MNWMNLPKEYATEDSRYIILPIEFEGNVTFGKGASLGSREIIKASKQLEYYDCSCENEPFEEGIRLLPTINAKNKTQEEAVEMIIDETEKILANHKEQQNNNNKNRFLISLGGDHSVTTGIIKGLEKYEENFSVIVFDAHADFRPSWNNSAMNHACVSKNISKKHKLGIIGVRTMDIDEHFEIKKLEKEGRIKLINVSDYNLEKLREILNSISNKVYISIDVDIFDPSIIRNTGTPEPGGLDWMTIVNSLKTIFKNKKVIGCDIVEFSPVGHEKDVEVESYILAKLVYRIMALHKKYNY